MKKHKKQAEFSPWEIKEYTHYKLPEITSARFKAEKSSINLTSVAKDESLVDEYAQRVSKKQSCFQYGRRELSYQQRSRPSLQRRQFSPHKIDISRCLSQNKSVFDHLKTEERAKQSIFYDLQCLVVLKMIEGQLKSENKRKQLGKMNERFESLFPVIHKASNSKFKDGLGERMLNDLLMQRMQ